MLHVVTMLFDLHVTAMSSISNEVMLVLEQQKRVNYFVNVFVTLLLLSFLC